MIRPPDSPPDLTPCDGRAAAPEHAVLVLGDGERAALRRHAASCEACAAAQEHVARVLTELVEELEPLPPSADGWERVRARIATADSAVGAARADEPAHSVPRSESRTGARAQPWKRWGTDSSDTWIVRRADADAWEPTAIPGIDVRPLSVSIERRHATMLVRMAPGTAYPGHRHGGPEECYVLSGDLQVGDELELKTGDFQRAESGSVHAVQSTRGGCTLLIQTSLDDELLPNA